MNKTKWVAPKIMCKTCNQERKATLYVPDTGKRKRATACDCGVYDKLGNLIHKF